MNQAQKIKQLEETVDKLHLEQMDLKQILMTLKRKVDGHQDPLFPVCPHT